MTAKLPEPRPYRDENDWRAMLDLLRAGRAVSNGTYYVHPGDVSWWLFYPDQSAELAERVYLWEADGHLHGWCLFTPAEAALDVFVQPEWRGSPQAEQMFLWAEARFAARLRAQDGQAINVDWILETDDWRTSFLETQGYTRKGANPYFTRSLAEPAPAPTLPEGYQIRRVGGEPEGPMRATASHAAFQSRFPFNEYWPRYQSFMRLPVYATGCDMMVVTPDGRCASFCIFWPDAVNKVALFEPVGTHPDFQRRGLGKALLSECLRRLQAEGMEHAIVGTNSGNLAAERLYESVGFKLTNRILLYTKSL